MNAHNLLEDLPDGLKKIAVDIIRIELDKNLKIKVFEKLFNCCNIAICKSEVKIMLETIRELCQSMTILLLAVAVYKMNKNK